MPWIPLPQGIKDACVDAVCGGTMGVLKGTFGLSFFTEAEAEEIASLKKLALSMMEKSPRLVSEPVVCEAIKQGQKSAIGKLAQAAPPEAIASGAVAAAELVCSKALKPRFRDILIGACWNLAGCP